MTSTDKDSLRTHISERYARFANADDKTQEAASCCSSASSKPAASASSCACNADFDATSAALGYSATDLAAVPAGANLGLGCGNPVAIASIRPGETILDLGSGAGFDCFLAARQLAGSGRVIGVDMTPAMIAKARRNALRSGYANVEFRLGEIEALPVADASIDLIISNCVVNLSPEKSRVFTEAFRVLRSGGRLCLSDIVAFAPLPASWREDNDGVASCIGGAETRETLEALLLAAGFTSVRIVPKVESREFIKDWDPDKNLGDFIISAIIEAVKP